MHTEPISPADCSDGSTSVVVAIVVRRGNSSDHSGSIIMEKHVEEEGSVDLLPLA
jgi:hypothetical protein